MEINSDEVELTGIRSISEAEIDPPIIRNNHHIVVAKDEVEEDQRDDEILKLKPGMKLRPQISQEDAIHLAEFLYGITTKEINELNSWDDRNYHIHPDPNIKNPIIPNAAPNGYVLKIINSFYSKKVNLYDAQIQLMLFLRQQGIVCPMPVMNIYGKYHSTMKIGDSYHLVRLFEFIPGELVRHIECTPNVFYQVGELLGKINMSMRRFKHEAYETHRTIWMLDEFPEVSRFFYAVKDVAKQVLAQQVLDAFEKKVQTQLTHFARGIIHGDFNEYNLIAEKSSNSNVFKIIGAIDFGDSCLSYYVFELAIAIAYMLIQSNKLETAGYVIAGYGAFRKIPEKEMKVLKICVAARIIQSLVYGLSAYEVDPGNEYILNSQVNGWALVSTMWSMPEGDVEELWLSTADEYLKRSIK